MVKKIGVLTSGGDSPGMNSAVRAVLRTAITYDIEVYGITDGYKGLLEKKIFKMDRKSASETLNRGGTFLGTARVEEFKQLDVQKKAVDILNEFDIDALITIGGDGTYRGALALTKLGIKCIGIPATIDNDIASTTYTIGFDTACNTIIDAIDKLRDTSRSHERCSIIEVMGRDCGDLAMRAGISSGAELVITNETKHDYNLILETIKNARKNNKRHALIVITENILDVHQLAKDLERDTDYITRATVLGYVQRGGNPSAYDRFMASWMGNYSVKLLVEGISGVTVGLLDGVLKHNEFEKALLMEKTQVVDFYKINEELI